jgi:hypothetical protein
LQKEGVKKLKYSPSPRPLPQGGEGKYFKIQREIHSPWTGEGQGGGGKWIFSHLQGGEWGFSRVNAFSGVISSIRGKKFSAPPASRFKKQRTGKSGGRNTLARRNPFAYPEIRMKNPQKEKKNEGHRL